MLAKNGFDKFIGIYDPYLYNTIFVKFYSISYRITYVLVVPMNKLFNY